MRVGFALRRVVQEVRTYREKQITRRRGEKQVGSVALCSAFSAALREGCHTGDATRNLQTPQPLRIGDMAKSSLNVLGKLLGGGLGFAAGGAYGALAGLTLGHAIDAGWMRWRPAEGVRVLDPRSARVEFLFLWMGHLAKADGRVSEGEVVAAERLMQRLQLDARGRKMAVRAFQRGRNQALNVVDEVRRFRQLLNPSREELGEMLRSLADFARNDGPMTPAERGLIERLGSAFGFNRESVNDQTAEHGHGTAEPTLAQCYATLGLDPNVGDAELTRAWRRLLARHHPDKLQGRGADAAALKRADARTRELRAAYERIVAARSERR